MFLLTKSALETKGTYPSLSWVSDKESHEEENTTVKLSASAED